MAIKVGLAALVLTAVAPLNASLMTQAYANAGADSCDVTGTEYASCTATGIAYYRGMAFPVVTGAWARAGYGSLEGHSLGGNFPAHNGTAIASFSDRITITSASVTNIFVFWHVTSDVYLRGTQGPIPGNSIELDGTLIVNDRLDELADFGGSAHLNHIVAFDHNVPVDGPVVYWTESGSRYPVENGVYVPEPMTYMLMMAGLAGVAFTRAIRAAKV